LAGEMSGRTERGAQTPHLSRSGQRQVLLMNRALTLLRRRLIGSIFVLLVVVIGSFLLLEAAPGDAVDAYIVSTGGDAGMIELLRHRWGLDQSELTRLANYLWALLHLDLGQSVTFSRPICDIILERLPTTL